MKIYLVGGAVRDKLLGLPIKERDWVVVGATVEEMLQLGYKQVGKEFPVFLHPKTNEEYALARMERKVKPGYKGFSVDTSPQVTLEDDLIRRDLTINAMAESKEGKLIDPYHGKEDLQNKILRHVSPAFAEDPVRILRLGRFFARYAHLGFTIAPETIVLMKQMVAAGEVDALVAERVWKELERALTEKNPEKFFVVLAECGALTKLFSNLSIDGPGIAALVTATHFTTDPKICFAVTFHAIPEDELATKIPENSRKKFITELCKRYRVPNEFRELATLTATYYLTALHAENLSAEELLQFFSALDIFRREERYKDFLLACQIIAQSTEQHFSMLWLLDGAQAAKSVDVKALVAEGLTGSELAEKLKEKRREQLKKFIRDFS